MRLPLLLLSGVVLSASPALAESPDEPPRAFEEFAGVPGEWTDVLNGYVYDPATYGPRLIVIERASGASLPPMFRMAAADAYLRVGNRRAAERIFEQNLAAGAGYPWDEFANLGMGTIRLASGDEAGAAIYFGRVVEADEAAARALGNLGLGAAYSAGRRFAEAKAAFDEAAGTDAVDTEVRQAGKFGSALALYGAGDFNAAARAFDELAKEDPAGAVGEDARFAAARARLAMGDREASASALRELVDGCDPKGATGRAPRALRNLDPRAMGRNWLVNYRKTGWGNLRQQGRTMYSMGGCSLARSTLRALERNDASLTAIQPVAVSAPGRPVAAPAAAAPGKLPSPGGAPLQAVEGASRGSLLLALAAIATVVVFWRVVGRGAKAG